MFKNGHTVKLFGRFSALCVKKLNNIFRTKIVFYGIFGAKYSKYYILNSTYMQTYFGNLGTSVSTGVLEGSLAQGL